MTKNNVLAAVLCYFLIGIIWYFVDEKIRTPFVKFHAKQGLNLTIIGVVVGVALDFLFFLPGIGLAFSPFITLINIGFLALLVIGVINAAKEVERALPIIGKFAHYLDSLFK